MNEEEKEAIECLELVIDSETDIETEDLTNKCINNILNLIKKLQKEIEELKDKNKKLRDKCKELIFEKQELTSALLDSTPNDKIKELREIDNIDLIQFKLKELLGE